MKEIKNLSLCEGRHEIPAAKDGSIFGFELDPLAVDQLEAEAFNKLSALEVTEVNIYVTGLSVALIAALNAAKQLGITVTLYHFDRNSGSYYPQKVK